MFSAMSRFENKIKLKLLVSVLFVFLYSFLFSQKNSKNVIHGDQQWSQYYNRIKLSEKYTLVSDGSFRWKNNFKEKTLALIRTGLSYNFHESNSVAFGIASTISYSSNRIRKLELRGWQEIYLNERIKRLSISNRIRLEERYFKNVINNELEAGYNFNYRFRYRFYVSIPLNNNTIKDNTVSINIGDEIFLNFGKEIVHTVFDNNRIITGITYQYNMKLSVTLNYVNQFSQSKMIDNFEENDIFWLSLTHNIIFKKTGTEK